MINLKTAPFILAGIAALILSACGGSETQENSSASSEDSPRVATAEEIAAYPMNVCVVSGEELGSMGDAVNLFHEGQLVRLCCDNCIDTFNDEPQKFVTKIVEAAAAPGGDR
jgi:hypothetical protein